mmetsp:Transcript_77789/g.231693  ORF Transcript_77789/g.231693 Transcript_77789/m.231693 type:complete len:256 (+) Transcript_77789:1053-1820(+)
MIQLLLGLVRGVRCRVIRDEPVDERPVLVLRDLPDGGTRLKLHFARPRGRLTLPEQKEGLGNQLRLGLLPDLLRPVLPDEVLQVCVWIGALRSLNRGLQVVLQVPQPGRLVDGQLHEAVLQASGTLLVHLLQRSEHHRQLLLEEMLSSVGLLDASVVLVLTDAGLLAQGRCPDAGLEAVRRLHAYTLEAILGRAFGLRTPGAIPLREFLMLVAPVLAVPVEQRHVGEDPLGDLPVLLGHCPKRRHDVVLDLLREL